MPPREDLNLPEEGPPESATAGAGAETPPEGTEQEVPEVEMAAAPEPLVAASKLPSAESVPSAEEEEEEVVTLREAASATNAAETNNHRSSTFLTEVEEQDDGASGPATTSLADIVAAVSEVENVGSIKEVEEKKAASDAKEPSPPPSKEASPPAPEKAASPQPEKETSPAPAKETSPAPVKETSPAPEKEASPAPEKETSPAPTKEASPAPTQEASPEPVKEASPAPAKEATPAPSKEESPAKEASPEPVKEASPAAAKEASPAKAEEEPIGAVEDLKAEVNALLSTPAQQDAEDEKVIEEAKKEIIDESEAKETEEEGAVINIQVIEEKKDDADVLDIVKAAEEAFVAEVIPDNEEVNIIPEEGEEGRPSPVVTEAPTPEMDPELDDDVIPGLGAIDESGEEEPILRAVTPAPPKNFSPATL